MATFSYDSKSKHAIVSDIGGTQIRTAVVNETGTVITRNVIKTLPENGINDAAHRLTESAKKSIKTARVSSVCGLGVATAGPIDPSTGRYVDPPNLISWHDKTMKPLLEKSLGLPVWIGHDATLAAFAETQFGPHYGAKNLLYVTVSTGVGGGIITNGEMVIGKHGHAGELGHITVRPGAEKCNVGCDGCLEGNVSGTAIGLIAAKTLKHRPDSQILKLADNEYENITSKIVFDAADDGDPIAQQIVKQVIENLGIGFGALINIFDPDALVVGGGVMNGLKAYWVDLKQSVSKHSLKVYRSKLPLYQTTHGDDAGLIGAAALVYRNSE